MVKEKLKKSKGITLIALIITIIILLILVAIATDIVIDGDMIGVAEEAVNKSNNKVGKLQNRVDEITDIIDSSKTPENTDNQVQKPETESPQITLAYSPTLDTWTNEDVTVTASVDLSGYDIQMSDDGTNWESGNTVTLDKNGKVYARAVKNGSQVGTTAEGEVTNIDKTPPEVGKIIAYLDDDTTFQAENNYFNINVGSGDAVFVKKEDGSDLDSGHKSTTYALYLDSELTENALEFYGWIDMNAYELTGSTMLVYDYIYPDEIDSITSRATRMSAYWIEIKTLDNAGNESRDLYDIVVWH